MLSKLLLTRAPCCAGQEITLNNNDGVMYYGPDIVHWRESQQSTLTQIVFAFREEDETHCNNQ